MIEPIPIPVPLAHPKPQGKAIGRIYDDSLPIFVHETVLEEILDYSEQDLTCEVGGFLLGGLYQDRRRYVELRHFLPARDAQSRAASLTFTHETWAMLHREAPRRYPDDVVLGWHHTHPGFGVFLSGYDLFIHRNFFHQNWQIAMVVDPKRQELGFFQWRGDQVADCGFICILDEGPPESE